MVTSKRLSDYSEKKLQSSTKIVEIVTILTEPLIGETCYQVRFSYGDELRLDFGELSPYEHPKLKHLQKGSWQFGTRATPWLLKKDHQTLLNSQNPETEEEVKDAKQLTRNSLENQTILKLELNSENLELQLSFTENYQLLLKPDLNDDDLSLADWEIFMPTQQILEVGPGYFWSCKSIHERY